MDYLANELYPTQFDGSLGYVDEDTRQGALWGEAVIDCAFAITNKVFGGHTYSCESWTYIYIYIWSRPIRNQKGKHIIFADEFAVTPGIHTQDLSYTFSERNSTMPYPKAQNALQQAIASFAMTGTPTFNDNGKTRTFPRYGTDESLVFLREMSRRSARTTLMKHDALGGRNTISRNNSSPGLRGNAQWSPRERKFGWIFLSMCVELFLISPRCSCFTPLRRAPG